MKSFDDCKQLLEDSTDETVAAKGCAKEIVRAGNGSSLSEAFLYQKDDLAVLRR